MSRLRDQLILIQKRNYRKNLAFIRETLNYNPKIARYEGEYHKSLKAFVQISDKDELNDKVAESDVVFHGDYHTLKHSQRSVLRLIRDAFLRRKIIVCLEMFHVKDQGFLDLFLKGKLTEKNFLQYINYEEKWPFPWKNFRPIVRFCKQNKIPIKGINSEPKEKNNSLPERDMVSARVILKEHIKHPDHLIYVVDGDYHICPSHLPGSVQKLAELMDVTIRRTLIYQNSEYLYWKLCKLKKEETSVLKINQESFCLMNTMPANKIQSYLNWLEYSEDAWFPSSEDWDDEYSVGLGLTVPNIIDNLVSLLGLSLPKDSSERREIFYGGDLNFMDVVAGIPELKPALVSVKNKIKKDEAFLLAYADESGPRYIIYLPNSNINMAAEESAHLVNVILRGLDNPNLPPFDKFYKKIVTECLGFFGSKLINEKRKSQNPTSLKKFIRSKKDPRYIKKNAKQLVLARAMVEHINLHKKQDKPTIFARRFKDFFKGEISEALATQLGYYLGNKLYYAVKKNKVSLNKVKDYFTHPMNEEGEPFQVFMDMVKRTRGKRGKKN